MKRFSSTYEDITSIERLLAVWRRFAKGKRHQDDVVAFQMRLMDNLLALHRQLAARVYVHGPYHAFVISDPKRRDIHKSSVRDRTVHHLLYAALAPYFDARFIHDSYSCRKDKGTHRALDRFRAFGRKVSLNNTHTAWVLKCDIRKFFASIDHAILKAILARHIEDAEILRLLDAVIDSFETPGRPGVGLPLGNLTSQLLVNVYMNELDYHMKQTLKARQYIRYADDFVIFHHDRSYLGALIPQIDTFISEKLHLELHPKKVSIRTLASGVDFLGWVHFPHHRVLRSSTRRRMFKKLSAHPAEESVNSYLGLLAHGNAFSLMQKIRIRGLE